MVPNMDPGFQASGASQPAADTGEEGEGEEDEKEIPWQAILKVGYVVFFSLISASLLFVAYLYATAERGDDDVVVDENTVNPGRQIQDTLAASESGEIYINWIPAKNSATKEGFKVKVNNVLWGKVRGRDERGDFMESDRPYINVFVEISNRSGKTFDFKSWYGNVFTSEAGNRRTAQISDDDKQVYVPIMFDDLADLKWWTPSKTFQPGEEGTDSIVFDVPEDFDPNKIENLYLDLPAEAVTINGETQGLGGSYRFKIPKSMIQGL